MRRLARRYIVNAYMQFHCRFFLAKSDFRAFLLFTFFGMRSDKHTRLELAWFFPQLDSARLIPKPEDPPEQASSRLFSIDDFRLPCYYVLLVSDRSDEKLL